MNNDSWNKASNLLFIESPAGVGFSYSTLKDDKGFWDTKTGDDMFTFLMRWYEKYPEFKTRDLFITGESYAGHYVPQLTELLLNHNKKSTGFKFPLKGIAIGNPVLNDDVERESSFIYSWSHGVISDEMFEDIVAGDYFARKDAMSALDKYIFEYDVLPDKCYETIVVQRLKSKKSLTMMTEGVDACINDELTLYFAGSSEVKDRDKKAQAEAIKRALNVDTTVQLKDWNFCSDLQYVASEMTSIYILPYLKRIIEQNIPVWVFSGDQDGNVPFLGTQVLMQELAHDLKSQVTVPHAFWFHKDQVAGWTTEYGKLLRFTIVRGAGHMVPPSQPERAFALFKSFISGEPLNTARPDTSFR